MTRRFRLWILAVAAVAVCAAVLLAGGAVAASNGENQPPLADAGLDQNVTVGETVYLDATGSRDPDGEVDSYEWSIETPSGDTIEPDCASCAETEFSAAELGQYNVTMTVRDDDGAERSDTLHVTVRESPAPSVTITGPMNASVGVSTEYTAQVSTNRDELLRVEWYLDGDQVKSAPLNGTEAEDSLVVKFAENETKNLTARAIDVVGRSQTNTESIDVEFNSSAIGGGGPTPEVCGYIRQFDREGNRYGPDETNDAPTTQSCSDYFENDTELHDVKNNENVVLELNGISGAQFSDVSSSSTDDSGDNDENDSNEESSEDETASTPTGFMGRIEETSSGGQQRATNNGHTIEMQ